MKIHSTHWNGLYLSTLTPTACEDYILYVHGGPGSHSAFFEAAVREVPSLHNSPYGWICFDQRGCGRSGKSKDGPTHEENIADLESLIEHLQSSTLSHPLLGILGHSYGGWLAFHTLLQRPDLSLPFVAVASAKDMRTAKNHSFAIDMLELRLDQPDIYKKLLPELEDFSLPLWEFQKRIREVAGPLKRRGLFMWANLQTMEWYNRLKESVGLPENWDLTHQISSKIGREHMLKEIQPKLLKSKMLWIKGAHDFLMDGDQFYPGEQTDIKVFFKSGHYPHFEEPERFIRELNIFFKKAF